MSEVRTVTSSNEWNQASHAEASTEVGAEYPHARVWRFADFVVACVAIACIAGYFAGVFA